MTNNEVFPQWLREWQVGTPLPMEEFFSSRVVFYPGSGTDGQPVRFFASRQLAHCFVYVDYGLTRAHIEQELGDNGHPFRGYRSIGRVTLSVHDLTPKGWEPHLRLERPSERTGGFERPFAFMEILGRADGFNGQHGPERLAVLFLCADGIASYDALFCQERNPRSPPYAVVLQDHGFGGHWDPRGFGSESYLERLAVSTDRLPPFLLVADNTRAWQRYTAVEGEIEGGGGVWGHNRQLWAIDR